MQPPIFRYMVAIGGKESAPKTFRPTKRKNTSINLLTLVEQKIDKTKSSFIQCKIRNLPLKLQTKRGFISLNHSYLLLACVT